MIKLTMKLNIALYGSSKRIIKVCTKINAILTNCSYHTYRLNENHIEVTFLLIFGVALLTDADIVYNIILMIIIGTEIIICIIFLVCSFDEESKFCKESRNKNKLGVITWRKHLDTIMRTNKSIDLGDEFPLYR